MIWAVNKLDQNDLFAFNFVVQVVDEDEWHYELNDEGWTLTSWVGTLTKLDSLITLEEVNQMLNQGTKDWTLYNQLCDMREEIHEFNGEPS